MGGERVTRLEDPKALPRPCAPGKRLCIEMAAAGLLPKVRSLVDLSPLRSRLT